jgi:ParB-like chromosome segregation protein Spo0J
MTELPLYDTAALDPGTLAEQVRALVAPSLTAGNLEQRVNALNTIREVIAELSPFTSEPVDLIRWVPADSVQANDYNPNAVAPPEMELLRLSIMADGYTQPIVTNAEDDARIVVDGFHRNRVGKECADVRERVHGYLPVVQIRADRGRPRRPDRLDHPPQPRPRQASGRRRCRHRAGAQASELVRRPIGRQLGMDPDEVLRLTQITGLAEAFGHRDFSEAWEAVVDIDDEDDMQEVEQA